MDVKENIGKGDRRIRALVALFLVAVFFNGATSGTSALFSHDVALIFIATVITGFSPFYFFANAIAKRCTPNIDRNFSAVLALKKTVYESNIFL